MLLNIKDVTGDLVLSKDECAYQEVVDSFNESESVTVVTYNISEKQNQLIDALKGLDCQVRLITQIPSRYEDYRYDWARNRANRTIRKYLSKLDPEDFGPMAQVMFCFSNHAKVVMTDRIGYIGSENYSEESIRNWEFGIVIRDPAVLEKVAEAVNHIEADSVRFYGPNMLKYVAPLLAARQTLHELALRFGEAFDEEQVAEFPKAIESLRDVIASSDRAWTEVFDDTGPICSRIDMDRLDKIENWFEEQLSVWELRESNKRLAEAEDGQIDMGEIPTDNDGNYLESAVSDLIENLSLECEEREHAVLEDVVGLQAEIVEMCHEIEGVCADISAHLAEIDNT